MGQISLLAAGAVLAINNQISTGALFAAVILNGRTIQPLIQLSNVLTKYSTAKASIGKLDSVFDALSSEEKRRQNLRLDEIKGPIVIRNLSFAPTNSEYSILTVPSLKIPDKQKVGIVGSVGSVNLPSLSSYPVYIRHLRVILLMAPMIFQRHFIKVILEKMSCTWDKMLEFSLELFVKIYVSVEKILVIRN